MGTATRQVNKSLQALNNDGEWTKLFAEKPSEHCDDEGNIIQGEKEFSQVYARRDKNNRQMAVEQLSTKALKAAQGVHPKLNWYMLKKDGFISIGWSRAIKIEAFADRSATLKFDEQMVDKRKINFEEIRSRFERLAAASSSGQTWCL